jgi:tetratricopeptide (TPR) repeat protein
MLFQYCKKTNDYTLAKNYALTLYEDNDLLRAKEINDIYITYIEENLPIDQLALELKSYADSILSQGKDRTAVSLHKQYLEIKFDQEDEDKTTQEIKDILDKYIKAKQFYMAREFAELALNKYPNCKLEDYFQLQLALCLFETKEVRKSKGIYYKILDEYPDSKYRSEALCQLLDEVKFYSYRDRQAALEEIESLKKYATNPITKAYLIITTAETYYLDKQYNKAINEYNLLLDTYPESVLALHAEKRIKECKELNN